MSCLAEELGIPDGADHAIEHLHEAAKKSVPTITLSLIGAVYEKTSEGSKMRSFIVEILVQAFLCHQSEMHIDDLALLMKTAESLCYDLVKELIRFMREAHQYLICPHCKTPCLIKDGIAPEQWKTIQGFAATSS